MQTNTSGSTVNEKNVNLIFYQQTRSKAPLERGQEAGEFAQDGRGYGFEEDGCSGAGWLRTHESGRTQARLGDSSERPHQPRDRHKNATALLSATQQVTKTSKAGSTRI